MAKSPPSPPRSTGVRTVAGIAVTIATIIFGVPALLVVTQRRPPAETAPGRVERYLAVLQNQDPASRHRGAALKVQELSALVQDPGFETLPPPVQTSARDRLQELTAYADYEKQLNALPAPDSLSTEEQLHRLQTQLVNLTPPAPYQLEWSQTEAGRRHDTLRKEVLALGAAVNQVRQDYQKLIAGAQEIVKNPNGEKIPSRSKALLDQAGQLPTPQTMGHIPGSERLGYASVFRFEGVADLSQRQWPPLRDKLKILAALAPSGGEEKP